MLIVWISFPDCLISYFAYGGSLILHRYLQIICCILRKYIPQSLPLKNARSFAPKPLPVLNKLNCPFRVVATNCRHMGQFSSYPPSSVCALPPSSLMNYMCIPVTYESPSSHSPSQNITQLLWEVPVFLYDCLSLMTVV